MSEQIVEVRYCANGTHHNEPKPREARHGHFCSYEHGVVRHALSLAPGLGEHLMSLVPYAAGEADSDRVSTSKEPPAPGNEVAMNDLHELYRMLTYWCITWARKMKTQAPGPAVGAWRNRRGDVIGLPAMTPTAARYAFGVMTKWLDIHLDSIFNLDVDDVNYFVQHDMRSLFALNARWPTEMRPRFSRMPCPTCKGQVAVYPPEAYGEDERIVCAGTCGRWFLPKDYEFLIGVFKDQKADELRPGLVRRHLDRKYGKAGRGHG